MEGKEAFAKNHQQICYFLFNLSDELVLLVYLFVLWCVYPSQTPPEALLINL